MGRRAPIVIVGGGHPLPDRMRFASGFDGGLILIGDEPRTLATTRRSRSLAGGAQSMTQDQMAVDFIVAAKVSDVVEGEALKVQIGDLHIALFKVDGSFYATEEICTHAQASLAEGYVDGDQVECPLHGACFSIKTGKALTSPATIDLVTYPVSIEDDNILIGVPNGGH